MTTTSTRTSQAASPEGRGMTIDDFVAYLPAHVYIFTPCRELWTGVSVNAGLPTDAGAHQEPASQARQERQADLPSPPLYGSTRNRRSSR